MTFAQLAQAVFDHRVRYDRDADLPTPNVYWSTVQHFDGRTLNGYVAAAHTLPAMRRVVKDAQETLHVVLTRANSVVRLRRLKLGDLMETPEAFEQALQAARARRESDIVQALEALPDLLAKRLGVTVSADDLWAALGRELDQVSPPVQLNYAQ